MSKPVVAFTFANHMHWVDMEWLWGYHVLPGSIRDMLHYCRELGIKGGVNIDGVGYEKLAAEDPESLQLLREAVLEGTIEPVGCSYGQPYGLFHGGESNVRQLIYGARSVRRLLGVWPKTFWEEEFYFFPQLPQMLAGCGFTGASLYFQWTWHTPEVPFEEAPVVWWEGHDGTRILTATRNKLNLHQWPEDVDTMLADMAGTGMETSGGTPVPLVQQWVELMPSPDWMCRSEVLIPKMREFLKDERFDVRPMTLGEYLDVARASNVAGRDARGTFDVRKYSMDDVWHGLTLGKNGDDMRHRSREAESAILLAETLATMASVLGRPYAQWDVYPVWELEEAWRELLAAQHHDNDECEGLCGRVGKRQYDRALGMANDIIDIQLARMYPGGATGVLAQVNQFGWKTLGRLGLRSVPPLSLMPRGLSKEASGLGLEIQEASKTVVQSPTDTELVATVDLSIGRITQLQLTDGRSVVPEGKALGQLFIGEEPVKAKYLGVQDIDGQFCVAGYKLAKEKAFDVKFARSHAHPGIDLEFGFWSVEHLLKRVSPGFKGALSMEVPLFRLDAHIYCDSAYAVHQVGEGSTGVRKYPEGDWMTSPQWFEKVEGAFVAQNFVDIVDPKSGEGLLIAHQGHQQWFKRDGVLRCILSAEDPWDEAFYQRRMGAFEGDGNCWMFHGEFAFIPHGPITHADRWKIGQEFRRRRYLGFWDDVPERAVEVGQPFSFADVSEDNVVVTALYREAAEFAGKHAENYALAESFEHARNGQDSKEGHGRDGHGNHGRDARATRGYPVVIRLVEFDGIETVTTMTVTGQVARAYKTNLLGQVIEEISATISKKNCPQRHPKTGYSSTLKVPMRPHEIATIYLDILEGRKVARDLDAKREVWAQVHRT